MRTIDSRTVEDQSHNDYSARSNLIQYKDREQILLQKEHDPKEIDGARAERLILLVRDPIEAITSHCLRSGIKPRQHSSIQREVGYYMRCVKYFDQARQDKHVLRYEDVVSDPFSIRNTIGFLGLSVNVEQYREKMQDIVKRSRETYHAGAQSPQGSLHHYKHNHRILGHSVYAAMRKYAKHPIVAPYFRNETQIKWVAKRPGLLARLTNKT